MFLEDERDMAFPGEEESDLTVSAVSSVSAVETGSQCKLICLKWQVLPRFYYPSGNKHEDQEDDDGIRWQKLVSNYGRNPSSIPDN